MCKAGEITDTLENSLAVLREYQDARETRQEMQLEPFSEENKREGIDKVNMAMTQVVVQTLTTLFCRINHHCSGKRERCNS